MIKRPSEEHVSHSAGELQSMEREERRGDGVEHITDSYDEGHPSVLVPGG